LPVTEIGDAVGVSPIVVLIVWIKFIVTVLIVPLVIVRDEARGRVRVARLVREVFAVVLRRQWKTGATLGAEVFDEGPLR